MIPRVTFMTFGTQKGGTSALNAVLCNHPDLTLCDAQEPYFFDVEANFRNQPDYPHSEHEIEQEDWNKDQNGSRKQDEGQ